jgi:hypothetical protein
LGDSLSVDLLAHHLKGNNLKKKKKKSPERKTEEEEDFVVSNNPRGEQPGRFWSPVFPSI